MLSVSPALATIDVIGYAQPELAPQSNQKAVAAADRDDERRMFTWDNEAAQSQCALSGDRKGETG